MSFPELSVIVPLFDEEANVLELYRRLTFALEGLDVTYEIVWINDGSRDRTAEMADALAADDARLAVIHLSRNFGHQAAISAGIDHARGQAVVVMDGDLQDPPEVVGEILDTWRSGFDVVYAIRTKRKEPFWKRAGYFAFYRLLHGISDLDIPLDAGDFCLMDRKVVTALRSMPERDRFVRGLRTFVGFRQTGVVYERAGRHAGTPKYTLRRLCRLALDGLFGFSGFPLSMIAYLGFASLLVALGLTAWTWIDPTRLPTGATTTLAVLYMGAVQLLGLGIVAEYLRRIFAEVKARPTYLVARVTEAEATLDDRRPLLVVGRKPK
ncbi:MAG TPA: glycosyltransferase family 2 protein [Gemmataceae bacterium]|jgi:dolichol-phosphate mannosyltransferase|nr:glycosyltransferase family 2 protein [Gemmataceae bacterium]